MSERRNTDINALRAAIKEALESEFPWMNGDGEHYTCEIYAEYDDVLEVSTINQILNDPQPRDAFFQALEMGYEEYTFRLENEIYNKVKQSLSDSGNYTSQEDDLILEIIQEVVSIVPPSKHFLKQSVLVNIFIDTGDGNYDFSLNPHYPCFYGNRWGEPIDSKAGIVWLAKQQGYTKKQLQDALNEGDMTNPKGFLQSCRVEEANLSCSMPVVAFLVEMKLRELINLNVLIRLTDASKSNYSYIVLDKGTVSGLYDPFNGGGGPLDIRLEKDVKIPIKYIRSALPDGCDGYSIRSCYGLDDSVYMDTVKTIHVPKKLHQGWNDTTL